jgi:hypothetical protein
MCLWKVVIKQAWKDSASYEYEMITIWLGNMDRMNKLLAGCNIQMTVA